MLHSVADHPVSIMDSRLLMWCRIQRYGVREDTE